MVWIAMFTAGIPFVIFDTIERKAYLDYYGKERTFDWKKIIDGSYTRRHFTVEVAAWEKILYAFSAVWGPTFVLGIFALWELFMGVEGIFILHILSNLMAPAYVYAYVNLYEICVFSDNYADKVFLSLFIFFTMILWMI